MENITAIAKEIYNINCPVFDIGKKIGSTGYIDFIDTNDFPEPFRKGIDLMDRKFISFRAIVEYKEGQTKETFTTLFKRYSNSEKIWMGAGTNPHLFYTQGGSTVDQLKLVLQLLKEKSVDVTEDMLANCRLLQYEFTWSDIDNNPPIRIYLKSNEN